MSNMNVNNTPQNPLVKSGKIPQNNQPQTENIPDAQTVDSRKSLSESQRKELFESQKKLQTNQPEENHEVNLLLKLDDVSAQELKHSGKNVPSPQNLDKVRVQVERSQTLAIQPQTQFKPMDPEVFKTPSDTFTGSLHVYNRAKNQLFNGNEQQQIKNVLKEELAPYLDRLSAYDKLGNRSVEEQQLTSQAAGNLMNTILLNTGKRDDFGRLIAGKTPEQLKALISELVGELREGKPRSFDKLSSKKQNFVNQVLDGIVTGRQSNRRPDVGSKVDKYHLDHEPVKREPSILTKAEDQLISSVQDHIKSKLNNGQIGQLKTKTDDELKVIFKDFIGTRDKKAMEGLVLKAIRTCPSHVAPRQVEKFVKDLAPDDLGQEVQTKLQQLSKLPGSHQVRNDVKDALREKIQGLNPNHNTIWQLGVLSEPQLKEYLQDSVGKQHTLNDNDLGVLVQEIRAMLPNRSSQNTTTLNGFQIPERITINGKEFVPQEFVAEAGFGAVFTYKTENNPPEIVAVKILKPEMRVDQDQKHDEALKELNLHRELQSTQGNKGIIGLIGAIHSPKGELCMVMEYATGGEVFGTTQQLDQARQNGKITEEGRYVMGMLMLKQALEGVDYMHREREMVHMDLKSANLMLGQDGVVKVIDFGTSGLGVSKDIEKRIVDNPNFLAPELMPGYDNVTTASNKSDIWSIGTLAFELLVGPIKDHPMLQGERNFEKENRLMSFMNTMDSNYMDQMPQPTETQKPVYDLINKMMMPTPEQRLDARELLALPIFKDERLDSEKLKQMMAKFSAPIKYEDIKVEYENSLNKIVDNHMETMPNDNRQEKWNYYAKHNGPSIRTEIEGRIRFERIQQDLQELGLT